MPAKSKKLSPTPPAAGCRAAASGSATYYLWRDEGGAWGCIYQCEVKGREQAIATAERLADTFNKGIFGQELEWRKTGWRSWQQIEVAETADLPQKPLYRTNWQPNAECTNPEGCQ